MTFGTRRLNAALTLRSQTDKNYFYSRATNEMISLFVLITTLMHKFRIRTQSTLRILI